MLLPLWLSPFSHPRQQVTRATVPSLPCTKLTPFRHFIVGTVSHQLHLPKSMATFMPWGSSGLGSLPYVLGKLYTLKENKKPIFHVQLRVEYLALGLGGLEGRRGPCSQAWTTSHPLSDACGWLESDEMRPATAHFREVVLWKRKICADSKKCDQRGGRCGKFTEIMEGGGRAPMQKHAPRYQVATRQEAGNFGGDAPPTFTTLPGPDLHGGQGEELCSPPACPVTVS